MITGTGNVEMAKVLGGAGKNGLLTTSLSRDGTNL